MCYERRRAPRTATENYRHNEHAHQFNEFDHNEHAHQFNEFDEQFNALEKC